MKPIASLAFGLTVAFAQLIGNTASAEIMIKSGEKIAFLGDSLTSKGWALGGYVRLVMAGLEANGVKAEAIPAGIAGERSNDMLARLDRDVISKKPQWMTLSCGLNDVFNAQKRGVPLDEAMATKGAYDADVKSRGTFKKNVNEIVSRTQAAGIKVVLMTVTVVHEELNNQKNAEVASYNNFLRSLAKDKNLPLADVNLLLQEKIKSANQPGVNVVTADGTHMNPEGNKLLATGVLKTFGLDAAQMAKATEAWVPLLEAAAARAKTEADARAQATPAAGTPAPKK